MISSPPISELLAFATELAYAGGRRTLAYFNTRLSVEVKGDGSPVTIADRAAEELMRGMLAARYPDHGVLGEEQGESRGSAPVRWVLDPIDGTKTFVRGVPLYGTLVGVEVAGEPVVGAIYMPALDELVAAGRGQGCTWNGRPTRVSETPTLGEALVVATDEGAVRRRLGTAGADALQQEVGLQRTWADCYGYLLVATGRADVALDPVMAIWDNAALLPIIEEAGGRFTDWGGARRIDRPEALASNGLLHEAMIARLKDAPPHP